MQELLSELAWKPNGNNPKIRMDIGSKASALWKQLTAGAGVQTEMESYGFQLGVVTTTHIDIVKDMESQTFWNI